MQRGGRRDVLLVGGELGTLARDFFDFSAVADLLEYVGNVRRPGICRVDEVSTQPVLAVVLGRERDAGGA